MYFTYILLSTKFRKTYTGFTLNLEKRLVEHNNGKSTFTKLYRPWRIIYYESFETKIEAIDREKYFKSTSGRRWIKNSLFEN